MPETESPVASVTQVAAIFDKIFEKDPQAAAILTPAEPAVIVPKDDAPPVEERTETEPVSAPVEELPETLPNEGRGDKWKQFRKAHEETKKELAALKSQQEEFGATRAERDELKARTAEYEEKIKKLSEVDSISRLENDPDFRAKYDIKRDSAIEKLKELAGYADIEPADLLSVLEKKGKDKFLALENVLELSPSVLKTKIAALVDEVDGIDSERRAELATARESLDARQRQREAREAEHRSSLQKQADEAFKRSASSLSKELGIDEATIAKAREFYDKNDDLEAASKIILKAFAADGALGKASEASKRITELEAELSRYRESSPSIGSGGDTKAAPKEMSFIEAIKAGAREQRII